MIEANDKILEVTVKRKGMKRSKKRKDRVGQSQWMDWTAWHTLLLSMVAFL